MPRPSASNYVEISDVVVLSRRQIIAGVGAFGGLAIAGSAGLVASPAEAHDAFPLSAANSTPADTASKSIVAECENCQNPAVAIGPGIDTDFSSRRRHWRHHWRRRRWGRYHWHRHRRRLACRRRWIRGRLVRVCRRIW